MQRRNTSVGRAASKGRLLGVGVVMIGGISAFGQTSFRGLGVPGAYPFAIASDGTTIVGVEQRGEGGGAFRWRRGVGGVTFDRLGVMPHPCDKTPESPECGPLTSRALAVSSDGRVVAGGSGFYDVNYPWVYPFRWTEAGGIESIQISTRDWGEVLAVSSDGETLFGRGNEGRLSSWNRSQGWSVLDSRVRLGLSSGLLPLIDAAVQHDRLTIVGFGTVDEGPAAFVLTLPEIGLRRLIDLNGGEGETFPNSISADGMWAGGGSRSADGWEAFRANLTTLEMEGLGDLPGGAYYSTATALSADGSRVVGLATVQDGANAFATRAFLWAPHVGMRDMREVLVQVYGLELNGWTLAYATDITPDGRTIIGWGRNPSGALEGWIVDLSDAACPADWNNDATLTSADFFAFIADFLCHDKSCRSADFNADGRENSQDFFDFVVAFFGGCG